MREASDLPPGTKHSKWLVSKQDLRAFIRRALPFALVVISAFIGVVVYSFAFPPPTPLSQRQVDESIQSAMASATPPPAYSSQVYQMILPSLVLVQTKQDKGDEDEDNKFGVGSGVIVTENGDILTAFHVVKDAGEIEVLFSDGTRSAAEIVSSEPENDIALLHPRQFPEVIVPAILGSAGRMRVGDEAYVVGNPLGLAASMSAGVISGFDRSIPIGDKGQQLDGLIQFDTAVNPGSSGGPLLNRQGQVVGIVTALANPSDQGYFIGIGFAVPIGTAVSVAGELNY